MSMHTPGPWRLDELDALALIDVLSGPVLVATVDGADNREINERQRANARLIAAAPDLLEAAKELLYWPSMRLKNRQTEGVGESVKKLQEIIERAEEKS